MRIGPLAALIGAILAVLAGLIPVGPDGGSARAQSALEVRGPTAEEAIIRSYDATDAWRREIRNSTLALEVVRQPLPLEDPAFVPTLRGVATAVRTSKGPRFVTSATLTARPKSARVILPNGESQPVELVEAAPGAGVAVYRAEPWPKGVVPLELADEAALTAERSYLTATGLGRPSMGDQPTEVIAFSQLLEALTTKPTGQWLTDVTLPWGIAIVTAERKLVAITTHLAPGTSGRAAGADATLLRRVLDTDEVFDLPDPFTPAPETEILPIEIRGRSGAGLQQSK